MALLSDSRPATLMRRPARPPTVAAARQPRLRFLDGFRLLAALAVMAYHFVGRTAPDTWGTSTAQIFPVLHRIAGFGWLGVELFFLISGFVICMSAWGKSLGEFLRGRALRLYPVYWFGVLLSSAVITLLPHPVDDTRLTLREVFTNLTMVQTPLRVADIDDVYWTLWREMCFYAIFALVVWKGLTYRRVANFCWIWLAASVVAPESGIPLLNTLADPEYSAFFIGGTAFYLIRRFGANRLELWGLVGCSWLLMQYQMPAIIRAYQAGDWTICVAVVTAMYVLMAVVALGWADRIQWRWLSTAGALSYPFYLIHSDIGLNLIHIGRAHTTIPPGQLLLGVVLVLLFGAWLVHRFVEGPSTRLLRRWTGKPKGPRPEPGTTGTQGGALVRESVGVAGGAGAAGGAGVAGGMGPEERAAAQRSEDGSSTGSSSGSSVPPLAST